MTPRMIASDIDGTFINSAGRVTPRLRSVVARAVEAGAFFCLATGRPHRWLPPITDQLPFGPVSICANGAVIYDPARDEIVHAFELASSTMAEVIEAVEPVMSDVIHGFGVERVGRGEEFLITRDYNPDAWDDRFGVVDVDELIAQPATKLLIRCGYLTSSEMFERIAPVVDGANAHVTYSMDEGLIEVSCPGVNKASSVALLAERYGVDAADVIAFGDMPNDLEMLTWAGRGIAMGNASPVLTSAADEVTDTNDNDGVAKILERWF
ncbi:HAD family hydrolase [Corynebacterium riegelii]|uniref:HAD family hydrolase n=1 Tax=Corynebacterium riegelii TaxID=156976 RepID=UPI00288AFA65|nr:HAD family hydrolase [Corynebacterium riegelii]